MGRSCPIFKIIKIILGILKYYIRVRDQTSCLFYDSVHYNLQCRVNLFLKIFCDNNDLI